MDASRGVQQVGGIGGRRFGHGNAHVDEEDAREARRRDACDGLGAPGAVPTSLLPPRLSLKRTVVSYGSDAEGGLPSGLDGWRGDVGQRSCRAIARATKNTRRPKDVQGSRSWSPAAQRRRLPSRGGAGKGKRGWKCVQTRGGRRIVRRMSSRRFKCPNRTENGATLAGNGRKRSTPTDAWSHAFDFCCKQCHRPSIRRNAFLGGKEKAFDAVLSRLLLEEKNKNGAHSKKDVDIPTRC